MRDVIYGQRLTNFLRENKNVKKCRPLNLNMNLEIIF